MSVKREVSKAFTMKLMDWQDNSGGSILLVCFGLRSSSSHANSLSLQARLPFGTSQGEPPAVSVFNIIFV